MYKNMEDCLAAPLDVDLKMLWSEIGQIIPAAQM